MKCLICLFVCFLSLSTHLKCHIRPNTGFPLARLINFATVRLAAANESDSEKRRSWRLLITQEAHTGEKNGTLSTSDPVISPRDKNKLERGEGKQAISSRALGYWRRRAGLCSRCLLRLALSPPLNSLWVTLHLMMNSGWYWRGTGRLLPRGPPGPPPWFMTYLSVCCHSGLQSDGGDGRDERQNYAAVIVNHGEDWAPHEGHFHSRGA